MPGGYDVNAISGKLGAPWIFESPGISIKPHPSGSLTHPGMTEMQRLIRSDAGRLRRECDFRQARRALDLRVARHLHQAASLGLAHPSGHDRDAAPDQIGCRAATT